VVTEVDCSRVAAHVHWDTIVVAMRPDEIFPPASKFTSILACAVQYHHHHHHHHHIVQYADTAHRRRVIINQQELSPRPSLPLSLFDYLSYY